MTVSRAEARARAILIAAATALALAAGVPAHAQSGGPILLGPVPQGERGGAADREGPGRGAPGGGTPGRDVPVVIGDIVVRGLDEISREAVGLLGDGSGGIGQLMWAGTNRAQAIRLVRALPARSGSPAAADLARRLLLTSAEPPVRGAGGPAETDSLLAARLDALVRMGRLDDAADLASTADLRGVPEAIAAPVVRLRFLTGDADGACSAVRGYEGGYGGLFWQKALVVCQLVAGDQGQAGLGLDLLREQGQAEDDPLFFALASAAVVDAPLGEAVLAKPAPVDAPTFALLARAAARHDRVALPGWLGDAGEPAVLRAVMDSREADADLRLAAAHAALRAGAATPDEVHRVYDSLAPSGEDIAAALLDPASIDPNRRLAYLYLSARRQPSPVARSEALWEAWTTAQDMGAYDILARMTAPLLADIPAGPDFAWISGHAARVSFLAGAGEQALAWYQLAERQAAKDAAIRDEAVALWPAARVVSSMDPMAGAAAAARGGSLAAVQGGRSDALPQAAVEAWPWRPERMEHWIAALPGGDPGRRAARTGAVLAVLEAAGDPVPEALWVEAAGAEASSVAMPGIDVLAGLARAAEAGRRAESALYALIALGEGGPGTVHPAVAVAAIRALDAVALEAEAAAVARETVLARLR